MPNSNLLNLFEFVKSIDFGEEVMILESKKDVYVKSKRRDPTKLNFAKILKSKNIGFIDKQSSKSSAGVIRIDGLAGDVIFKPMKAKGAGGLSFEKELLQDLLQDRM